MIDYEPIDVPQQNKPYEEGYVKIEPKSHRPNPNPKPKEPKPKPEPEPKPIISEPKPGIDTTRITEESRAFAATSVAKLMILLTWLVAVSTKTPPLMMTDKEAIDIAIPATTLLLRIKWFQELFKQYGQYFLSFDEYILLGVAVYAYYSRLEHDLERSNPNYEPTRPARQQQAANESASANGLTAIARPIEWRTA